MSGDLPLSTQAYFCNTHSPLHSPASRSMFCTHSSIFWNVCSPLLSRLPRFLPAVFHFHSSYFVFSWHWRTFRHKWAISCHGSFKMGVYHLGQGRHQIQARNRTLSSIWPSWSSLNRWNFIGAVFQANHLTHCINCC